jgi:hypothetical protein
LSIASYMSIQHTLAVHLQKKHSWMPVRATDPKTIATKSYQH